jgi:hypothetical protein
MMGTKVRSFAPLPDDLSLEDLVLEDNFYRRLEAALDLSFVRELVGPLYANGGRPSVDPDASLMQYKKGASRMGYHTLRGGRGQGARDPERAGHPGGRHGEPAHARSAVEDHLPLAGQGAQGHRRRHLRHQGHRSGRGEGVHTCLLLYGRLRGPQPLPYESSRFVYETPSETSMSARKGNP